MATVSTGQVEAPPATGTLPRCSRWRVTHNVLLVMACLGCGGFAIFSFVKRDYLIGSLQSIFALTAGVQLGFLIAGRDSAKDIGNWLVKHPWLGVLVYTLLSIGTMVFLWLFVLDLKNKGDQLRAAEAQVQVQAAQPAKGTR